MPLLSARTVSRRRRLQLFAFFVRPGPAASKRALCGPGQEDGCHQCTRLVLRKCTLRVFRPRFCHNSHSSFLQHTQYETVLDIRRQHDRGFPRWMSHVTFCYPFVERSEFGAYFEKLKSIRCEPFEVVFDKIGHFRQKDGYTVHLAMGEASLMEGRRCRHGACGEAARRTSDREVPPPSANPSGHGAPLASPLWAARATPGLRRASHSRRRRRRTDELERPRP